MSTAFSLRSNRLRIVIGLVLLAQLMNSFALTQEGAASDFHSPRTAALGGAGHASPLLNDAILLNPSFASFLKNTVSAGVSYQSYEGPSEDGAQERTTPYGRNYQVSMQDSRTELFQAGVSYTVRRDHSMVHIGAAKTAIQRLGFGLGSKLIFPPGNQSMEVDANVSTTFIVTPEIFASLMLDNIIASQATRGLGLTRELILGTKFNVLGIILLYLDPHFAPDLEKDRFGIESGVEIVLFRDLFLRGGIFRKGQIPYFAERGDGYGLGVGWIAPRLSLDYSYAKVTAPVETMSHSFGLTVFF